MTGFGIGEVAQQVGLNASTIRYYEHIGLLPASERVNGKRRYDESVFQQLGTIQLAKSAGLNIGEIQKLLHDFPDGTPPSERWASLARQKIIDLNQRMAQIIEMKAILEKTLACDCPTLQACGVEASKEREV